MEDNKIPSEVNALKSENAELRTRLEKAGPDPVTAAKLAILEKEAVQKDESIADLQLAVAKLSKGMEKATKGPVDMPEPIKVGKTMYRFAIPAVRYKAKKITAQDVADNKDLAAELVAQGSGMLVEV
jgi:hypothetical protein